MTAHVFIRKDENSITSTICRHSFGRNSDDEDRGPEPDGQRLKSLLRHDDINNGAKGEPVMPADCEKWLNQGKA